MPESLAHDKQLPGLHVTTRSARKSHQTPNARAAWMRVYPRCMADEQPPEPIPGKQAASMRALIFLLFVSATALAVALTVTALEGAGTYPGSRPQRGPIASPTAAFPR